MAVWEKVLWKTQPFDDNHVPADFLSELDRLGASSSDTADPAIKSAPSLTTLILAALPISQHVSAIALLVAVFYRLLVNTLSASVLGLTLTSATILGWTLLQYGWKGMPGVIVLIQATDPLFVASSSRPSSCRCCRQSSVRSRVRRPVIAYGHWQAVYSFYTCFWQTLQLDPICD
jgi:hypothetical protein